MKSDLREVPLNRDFYDKISDIARVDGLTPEFWIYKALDACARAGIPTVPEAGKNPRHKTVSIACCADETCALCLNQAICEINHKLEAVVCHPSISLMSEHATLCQVLLANACDEFCARKEPDDL